MNRADPMLAKIRKLLAKAEDPAATAAEAETYTLKAAQLIADYGIDRALLAVDDPGSDIVGDRVVVLEAPYAADKADLLSTVAVRLRCSAVRRKSWTPEGHEISLHLFGHQSDLERSDLLFTSLLLQATSQLARTPVPPWDHAAAFRRSWLAGFRIAIGDRLLDIEDRAASERHPATGRSTTLVLADRTAEVEAARDELYPDLRTSRPRSLSGSGGRDGWNAGQRADIGGTRLAGSGRMLPR